MLCEHLRFLDEAISAEGFKETFRGAAWSKGTREWVYYDGYLNREAIRTKFHVASCVIDHEHYGTHDGQEEGLVCEVHQDAIMGIHRKSPARSHVRTFPRSTA
jgi:hypothetical protein